MASNGCILLNAHVATSPTSRAALTPNGAARVDPMIKSLGLSSFHSSPNDRPLDGVSTEPAKHRIADCGNDRRQATYVSKR